MPYRQLYHRGLCVLIGLLLLSGALPALAGGHLPVVTPATGMVTRHTGAFPAHQTGVFEDAPCNVALFRLINDHHCPWLDSCARFLDTLGIPFERLHWRVDIGIGWTLLPIFILTYRYRRHMFGALLLGLAMETLLVVLSKQLTHQPRPAVLLPAVHQVLHLTSNSFPSGHTAMVTVLAGIMVYREKWWLRLCWVLFVLIIAYQRMYTGVHFPLDVLAGLLIGGVSAMLTLAVTRRKIHAATPPSSAPRETAPLA